MTSQLHNQELFNKLSALALKVSWVSSEAYQETMFGDTIFDYEDDEQVIKIQHTTGIYFASWDRSGHVLESTGNDLKEIDTDQISTESVVKFFQDLITKTPIDTKLLRKIGDGYFRSGYGRNALYKRCIYLIDGYAYAKDLPGSRTLYAENEITKQGFVPVNISQMGSSEPIFCQASLHTNEHRPYQD